MENDRIEAATDKIKPNSNQEMEKVWLRFADSVQKNDPAEFKKLSTKRIACGDCLSNEEESIGEKLREFKQNNGLDLEKILFIPVDRFLQKNYSNIFDEETRKVLKNSSRYSIHRNETIKRAHDPTCFISDLERQSSKRYEILVTVHKPIFGDEITQKGFSFIQTKKGLQFCGTYLIP